MLRIGAAIGTAAAGVAALRVTTHRAATERRLQHEHARYERERAALFDRMIEEVDQERRALAHRLHDGPQQTMTAIRLMADVVRDAIRSGDRQHAEEVLTKLEAVASEAADDLRRTTARLHPVVMAQQGLVQALGSLAETVHEEYGVTTTFHPPPTWDGQDERDTAIFRIAREAAVNAAKHGDGPVEIRLETEPQRLLLSVADRGGGLRDDGIDSGGIGLPLMRERAARLGATLEFTSEPRNTVVALSVPVGIAP